MPARITDDKRAWDRLRKELIQSGNKEVTVGIQKGEINEGVLVAQYATWNEFGTGKIPSRAFMRTYFDSSVERIIRFSVNGISRVVAGSASYEQFLSAAGIFMVDGVKKSITSGAWTANAPYTIAKKKSSKPLIDTGVMLSSVTFSIGRFGAAR